MTRHLLTALAAVAALLPAACSDPKKTAAASNAPGDTPSAAEIGAPLFEPAAYAPPQSGARSADPITVQAANVVILHKVDVPSEVDGVVRWVGVEMTGDTPAPKNKSDLYEHPRDKKMYRRLQPGNFVRRGQVIALLEDELAYIESQVALSKAEVAKQSAEAYKGTVAKLLEIVAKTKEGVQRGIVPQQELLNSEATLARYQADYVDRQGAARQAAEEAERYRAMLGKRTLRAPLDGEVQLILKQPGEGVRPSEPVLVLHDFSKLRAVGLLPKEYVNIAAAGDEVTIEMPRDFPPAQVFNQHTTNKPVTAVAVTTVRDKPVIVSAADDGWVYAWDRDLNKLGSWRQPAGVRALAVTKTGMLLVGSLNGTARLYDLSAPDRKEPTRELDGLHSGGVLAAAFSPNGEFCVTSDERGIYLYDVSTGKRKYAFPPREHFSVVTALHFTPQGKVVSVAREPSVRVWSVGNDGARVEHRIDSRSGDVLTPGVTDDGSRLLLDADKTHLDVIHLEDLRKERPLLTAGEAGRFTTFTAWSPALDKNADKRLIATTGGVEGVVQLWRAPTAEQRGVEVARFVTRQQAAATCAAFSPSAKDGFLVVGTRKGEVHLWPLPAADVQNELPATVTHVEQSIESSGRTVNVLVNFDNPKLPGDRYRLRPGSTVTLVIHPKK